MKLFEKYNRLNIAATIFIFVVGSCTFYFLLNYIFIRELDETLQSEQQEVVSYVGIHNSLPESIRTREQYTYYEPAQKLSPAAFLTIRNKNDKEDGDLREIRFGVSAAGKYYLVRVDKPLEGTEALLQIIVAVTVAMIGLILLAGYIINRLLVRRLWDPFYKTIDKVRSYSLADQQLLKLDAVGIEEFALLNESINGLMERIHDDYTSLKDFTGQAAHEMQTPLAIIRTKLDMLMQNEVLLEKNAIHITDIERAVQRLSRLHQSLLLLTKVENRQFVLNEDVTLDVIIRDKCAEYAEMAESMSLAFDIDLQPTTLIFHQHLIEILVSNLLGNAIRYNINGGTIHISLHDRQLIIANTSFDQQLDTRKLFKRFYREQASQDGNGLGLSIVKQICELGTFAVSYSYENQRHIFAVQFR